MAEQKLPLKDILAAVDYNAKSAWKELSDDERKQVSFWLLNRYVSNVEGNYEKKALAVFKTNEYFNKNFNELQKNHKQLLWQLLCASGGTGKIEFHPWMGLKQKKDVSNKAVKLLMQIYPNKKQDEVELLARISTTKEIKELASEHGYDKVDL